MPRLHDNGQIDIERQQILRRPTRTECPRARYTVLHPRSWNPRLRKIESLLSARIRNAVALRKEVRDVGVAGSNPVTPTIDFKEYFYSQWLLGVM
jgi:hypothetical protein